MKYAEYIERTSFNHQEVLALSHGNLVEDAPHEIGRLPMPPLLMFDRVTEIVRAGPRGRIVGEHDVRLDAWYFQCHFGGDAVKPGSLGVEGAWQLVGLYMSLCGCPGVGRALGCKEIDFFGQIRPYNKVVTYTLDVRRLTRFKEAGASLAIADATIAVDGQVIYTMAQARIGKFVGIAYPDYPLPSKNSIGGVLDRGST
jgi:3-hydroxyacyl-[acyl-carrier protein] dehydratase / trans-2-decenoyl-[acyl-carrier protein] isomerase